MLEKETTWYLKQIDIFKGLDCDELNQLGAIIQDHGFSDGQLVTGPGRSSSFLFMIKKGKVKISLFSESGKEHILALLTEGDIFGDIFEPGIFSEKMWVYALEPALICSINRKDFSSLISQFPLITLKVVKNLSQRLNKAENQIESLSLQRAPQRLANLLLRLGETYGENQHNSIHLTLKLTHQDMANMTGMTRQTVTLLLNQWENDNVLKRAERTLILFLNKLKEKI